MKLKNTYYIMRHGEALSNVKGFLSSWPEKVSNSLTEKGFEQAETSGKKLLTNNIDLIFSSDVLRCDQTSEVISKRISREVKFDKRLREIDFGNLNGKPIADLAGRFASALERINGKVPKGESYEDVLERIKSFLDETEKSFKGKTILIVSHQAPLFILEGIFMGYSLAQSVEYFTDQKLLSNCEIRKLN